MTKRIRLSFLNGPEPHPKPERILLSNSSDKWEAIANVSITTQEGLDELRKVIREFSQTTTQRKAFATMHAEDFGGIV